MVNSFQSRFRPFAVAAVALALLVPSIASATDPTPDPAEPSLTGSGMANCTAPISGALV